MTTHAEAVETALQSVRELSTYRLANMAEVASPDSLESAGAQWLDTVRVSFLDARNDDENADDVRHEIADAAVPVYSHHRMLVLVDLAAWQEDLEDLAGGSGAVDIIDLAGLALYQVAERLVEALTAHVQESLDAADIDDEDDDTDGADL
jgi:hypothetical protein